MMLGDHGQQGDVRSRSVRPRRATVASFHPDRLPMWWRRITGLVGGGPACEAIWESALGLVRSGW